MPHHPLGPICTAATAHLAAAAPNFAWLEVRVSPTERGRFSDPDIFPTQPVQDGARLGILDGPGLGIEVNEEAVRKQSFKFWEAPHLHRRDGSYTNW
jgi:galactonate dehydratase